MSQSVDVVAPSSTRAAVEVDPALAAVIRNAGRPVARSRSAPFPKSLAGVRSPFARLAGLYAVTREGAGYYERLHARYGEIYISSVGAQPVVSVWDADEVHKIVRNEASLWSAALGWQRVLPSLDARREVTDGMLARDFDEHRLARKLVQPAFTGKAIKGYIERTALHFERAIPRWIAAGGVGFKRAARSLLAQVANEIFTGFDDQASIDRIDQALVDAWRVLFAVFQDPRLSPTFRKAQRGYGTLHETFSRLVDERRARPGTDLFSLMCSVEDTGGIDDASMVDLFVSLMFAAFDTTSAGVTSMAYLLAKHPRWQERLREEARSVPSDALDWAGLAKLESLEWAWKETLRLMPIAGQLPRSNLRATELLGHRLSAGTFVAPAAGLMGRHPKWWSEPLAFDPERFSPARAEDRRHPAIYMPFGAGAHACVGLQLATLEAKLLFHHLLTRCRFELAHDYEAHHTFTPMGMVSGAVELRLRPL